MFEKEASEAVGRWMNYIVHTRPAHERVVRCRDCIHYSDEIGGYCELLEFANTDMADGFCAWASQREDA